MAAMRANYLSQLITIVQRQRQSGKKIVSNSNLAKPTTNKIQATLGLQDKENSVLHESPDRKGFLNLDPEQRLGDEEALTAIQQPQFVDYLNDLYVNMQSSGKSG